MIDFRIDRRSGIPTYVQLVLQVKQALRLGDLQVGDRLPTAKDVVGALAINPNTVLKGLQGTRARRTCCSAARIGHVRRQVPCQARYGGKLCATARVGALGGRCRGRWTRAHGHRSTGEFGTREDVHRSGSVRKAGGDIMTAQESALTMQDVDKRFGKKKVLDACTFEIATGSITALVGVNGAGKSTLMSLAVGLTMPDHGSISVLGSTPDQDGICPGLSYLAQHKPLYPKFTVAELLRFGAYTNDEWDAKYALDLVERAGIALDAKAKTLSPGQRTRVALALALGRRPQLLLLDEPLADLDPVARRSVATTLLEDVAEYGTTVLLSSHIVSELADVSDRLLLLGGGNARLSGPLDGIDLCPLRIDRGRRPLGRGRRRCGHSYRQGDAVEFSCGGGNSSEPSGRLGDRRRNSRRRGARAPERRNDGGGMIWVTWRHHRTSLIVSLGFIAALAMAAIVGGIGTRSSLGAEGRGTYFGCVGVGWDCWADTAVTGVNTIAAALPVLLGALVGATVFSRDIDQQTHVLGLTQSVSRARWFWMRVIVVFLPLTAAAAILGFILEAARVGFESWSYVVNVGPVQSYGMSSMLFPLFNSSGIVLGAYTFMALVAGAAVSLLGAITHRPRWPSP